MACNPPGDVFDRAASRASALWLRLRYRSALAVLRVCDLATDRKVLSPLSLPRSARRTTLALRAFEPCAYSLGMLNSFCCFSGDNRLNCSCVSPPGSVVGAGVAAAGAVIAAAAEVAGVAAAGAAVAPG